MNLTACDGNPSYPSALETLKGIWTVGQWFNKATWTQSTVLPVRLDTAPFVCLGNHPSTYFRLRLQAIGRSSTMDLFPNQLVVFGVSKVLTSAWWRVGGHVGSLRCKQYQAAHICCELFVTFDGSPTSDATRSGFVYNETHEVCILTQLLQAHILHGCQQALGSLTPSTSQTIYCRSVLDF